MKRNPDRSGAARVAPLADGTRNSGQDGGWTARSRGQHPWTFKPTTCWMFPLQDDDGDFVEPVRNTADDPYVTSDYPGYASCVPCGRHDPAGVPWRQSLAREIQYFEAAPELPLFGTTGHTVEELLAGTGGQPCAAGKKNPA